MLAPITSGERRQDSQLCLASDFLRHTEQAASESSFCCSCWTCWELSESLVLGYCPFFRIILLPVLLIMACVSWAKMKLYLWEESRQEARKAARRASRKKVSWAGDLFANIPRRQAASSSSEPLLPPETL